MRISNYYSAAVSSSAPTPPQLAIRLLVLTGLEMALSSEYLRFYVSVNHAPGNSRQDLVDALKARLELLPGATNLPDRELPVLSTWYLFTVEGLSNGCAAVEETLAKIWNQSRP